MENVVTLRGGLNIEFQDGREPVSLQFSASDEDESLLRRYADSTRALMEAVRRAGGLPVQLTMSFEQGQVLQFRSIEPTEPVNESETNRLRV